MSNPRPPEIGYLLKKVQSLLHARMDEALDPFGLTVSQYVCLNLLDSDPGISASELARAAFVTRQSMNALLHTLLDRGLVDRPATPDAGRALPAVLTDAGAALMREAKVSVDGVEQRMLSGLSHPERDVLGDALATCVRSLA